MGNNSSSCVHDVPKSSKNPTSLHSMQNEEQTGAKDLLKKERKGKFFESFITSILNRPHWLMGKNHDK